MQNLTERISSELLPRIRRPGQYIGLETNARRKGVDTAPLTVALAFPDTYGIGISHLGTQLLYALLNDRTDVACDRTYCPEPDAAAVMRERDIPLFGWESRCALRDFDLLGFSLGYELCVTNVLTMLDLAGIPLRASDRREDDPIVLGGDALADSPEPVAPFFDIFIVGDGERPLLELTDLLARARAAGASRREILLQAARTVEHVYVPSLYRCEYHADGTLAALEPAADGVPSTIRRACLRGFDLEGDLTRPLVPVSEGVHERVVVEIMRGCPNACRFCQAGSTRLPVRPRPADEVVSIATAALESTGYDELALLSLSSSDYPDLAGLIERLNAELAGRNVSISLPSLRVNSQLEILPKLTSKVRKGGLTIAAEAGSERLRRAIRKRITESDMIVGVRSAYEAGWRRVKVYFMAGLPGETDEDIRAIAELSRRLSDVGRDAFGQPGSISAGVSWFVPKPHTPMQFSPMRSPEYFMDVRSRLRELTRRSAVNVKFHWVERSLLEGVIARGDRRVADVIEAAWRDGARLDSWNEHFEWSHWQKAFEQTGLDPAFYAHREIPLDERTPWQHIVAPRTGEMLRDEHRRMIEVLNEVQME
jgi:radical SAM family uncharacterized protein